MKLSQNNTVIVLGLVAIIGITVFVFSTSPKDQGVQSSLENIRLLVATGGGQQLFELGSKKLEQKFSDIDGDVLDYSTASDTEVLIVSKDGIHRVLARVSGGEWQTISASPFEKSTLELSDDGNIVGFSERIDTEADSTNLDAWQIVLHSLDTADTEVVSGYSPQFVTVQEGWTLVYLSSSSGIAMYEPVSKDIIYFSELIPPSTQLGVRVSADGKTLIAYNPLLQDFVVFDLQDPTSISLSALGTVPLYNDVYMKNGLLFGLDLEEEGNSVWTHSLSELDSADEVYKLPQNIDPLKFVLSSR
ncbi:hypothetical protein COU15_03075 [Candidatus Kaiserbacteria bacterium CG10_big_fil_rev_8_21_14_0_10_45_20]|uniref:Uncharacterized protein n=1 Tax=Candidatus Kaiserbacteria bacterium CG10_big_fil_rev_8_21_14_0_10_45_20 TaxID=1974607 RepID=A0A2H0UF34_9BACT|nr:MAG: hypothetical protein COU15_03075 [Candidatus Kaiserbacteria bacterium CG10_big_fil_rev_8_21_14_0_10_45_20]